LASGIAILAYMDDAVDAWAAIPPVILQLFYKLNLPDGNCKIPRSTWHRGYRARAIPSRHGEDDSGGWPPLGGSQCLSQSYFEGSAQEANHFF
jgi:hypothetical protein